MKKTLWNDGETHQVAHIDNMNGDVSVQTYQDVEPHLEACAAERRVDAEERGAFGKRGEWRKTMSVPFNVINDICLKHGLNFYDTEDAKKIARILKGVEYKNFRTTIDKNI